ncbi:hypothetical protein N9N67_10950, partial [Bacteriovoracaceae bacterium]|nr:hypothetical protein [Bacteriovoracaceae bacterium]
MRFQLKTVSIVTLSLFFVSLIVFYQTNRRGSGFIEGTEVFPGLDVNKVAKVEIQIPKKNTVTLSRSKNEFIASDFYSLPIDNNRINSILFDISNMQIKDEVFKDATQNDLVRYELD